MHYGTNNSRGSKRSRTSFQKYVRESCSAVSLQWNTEGENRHVGLRAILFYLCLNILKHCATRTPPVTLSSCFLPSPNHPFKHSPVIPDISENTKPSVSLMHLSACFKDAKQRQSVIESSWKKTFSKKYEE